MCAHKKLDSQHTVAFFPHLELVEKQEEEKQELKAPHVTYCIWDEENVSE